MYDIITIGSATRDAFFEGIEFDYLAKNAHSHEDKELCLPLGAKMSAKKVTFTTGGAGTNAAVTFARLGLKTAAIVRVGEDVSGEEVKRNLTREGVDISFIQMHPLLPTSYSVILMAEKAERTILVFKGAGGALEADAAPWNTLKTKWFYLDSLSRNEEILKRVADFKQAQGVKIAWNPGTDDLAMGLARLTPYLSYIDIFIANAEEASTLVGIPSSDEEALFKRIDELIGGIAIMTMGPQGVMVSDGKTIYHAGTFPEKQLIDRTGAGDAFGSGFVFGYLGSGIREGIRVGSANSTSVLEHVGAKEGILYAADLENERWQHLDIVASLF